MTSLRQIARPSVLPAALAAALIALAALCGAVALAPAAHAHDQLISTDPADGDTLAESPEELRLTFSGEIQDIGSAVELTDADAQAYDVELAVERADLVLTPAQPLQAGDYTLAWRVTSSDGHPIEGTVENDGAVDFTVESGPSADDEASAATSAPAEDGTATPTTTQATASPVSPEATASESSGPIELDLTEEESGWATPLIIILLAAAALAAVIVVIVKVRNQQK
ncbi:copper resistance CopC family protein [Zhihengliuella flava]|uniref:Methionine-rich copper-binding protein CopC n=1 Tax=Zhihengliuella flava TaxID=1285193 RepID=A0A931DCB5_9MICC|nr:copper resistance CopC family protein [Zhihengliuella flava]MBG6084248.1 methionine-rich copper-binding protein CopC [Zhihengliuella flava]